jgi:hypothetical protein
MRRYDTGLVSGGARGGLLLVAFSLAAVVPPGLVMCRGTDGHLAVESQWEGCCNPVRGEGHCAPLPPTSVASAAVAGDERTVECCRDLSLGADVAVSRGPDSVARPAAAIPAPAAAGPGGVAGRSVARGLPPPACAQVRDALRSTVLTL